MVIMRPELKEIDCDSIVCACIPPRFMKSHNAFAYLTMCGGIGLWLGTLGGCYGCKRSGCFDVCFAGVIMSAASYICIGLICGLCVGCSMLNDRY